MVRENGKINGNLFPRRLDQPLSPAVKAEGVWIEDASAGVIWMPVAEQSS